MKNYKGWGFRFVDRHIEAKKRGKTLIAPDEKTMIQKIHAAEAEQRDKKARRQTFYKVFGRADSICQICGKTLTGKDIDNDNVIYSVSGNTRIVLCRKCYKREYGVQK